jgi:hypothetical protein
VRLRMEIQSSSLTVKVYLPDEVLSLFCWWE